MPKHQIPDEALFYLSEGYDPVDRVLRVIYNNPSPRTRDHFLRVNSHLKDGVVKPGQMVIITPPESNSCQQWEAAIQKAALLQEAEIAKMNEQERKNLARHYAMLHNVTTYTAPMYGWANNYFKQRTQHLERILKQIDSLYVTTYSTHGNLRTDHFFSQRKLLFTQMNQAINGMLSRELFGQSIPASNLKHQLGISSKATLHQWKMQGGADSIKGFSSNYQRLTRTANVFSRLGYVAIGLEVVGGVANIRRACLEQPESDSCAKIKFTETGKIAGSIGLGMAGGLIGYSACNLVFGIPSAGTSLLWCGILAGAAGSYTGSKVGSQLGESGGELLYEKTMQ